MRNCYYASCLGYFQSALDRRFLRFLRVFSTNLWLSEQLPWSSFLGGIVRGSKWCSSQMGWCFDLWICSPNDSRTGCYTNGPATMSISCIAVDDLKSSHFNDMPRYSSNYNPSKHGNIWKRAISGPFSTSKFDLAGRAPGRAGHVLAQELATGCHQPVRSVCWDWCERIVKPATSQLHEICYEKW